MARSVLYNSMERVGYVIEITAFTNPVITPLNLMPLATTET